mmetsp:Transcript_3734/g.7631  ORF Transcript_3734/g.7631 Transcript_3734/m.7631 type:complete len:88 (+) Transcript_3734:496-759(+)
MRARADRDTARHGGEEWVPHRCDAVCHHERKETPSRPIHRFGVRSVCCVALRCALATPQAARDVDRVPGRTDSTGDDFAGYGSDVAE